MNGTPKVNYAKRTESKKSTRLCLRVRERVHTATMTTTTSTIFKCYTIGHMAEEASTGLGPIQRICSNEERNKCSSRCRRQFYKTCRQTRRHTRTQTRYIFVQIQFVGCPAGAALLHHLLANDLIWFDFIHFLLLFFFPSTISAERVFGRQPAAVDVISIEMNVALIWCHFKRHFIRQSNSKTSRSRN